MAGTWQHWKQVASAIRAAGEISRKWTGTVPQEDGEKRLFTPWMPFPVFTLIAMTAEAIPEINGGEFLEIGAGPGPNMLALREIFGLQVHGIERTDDYAAAARMMGLDVTTADALEWPGYGGYGLIWFNRVFRDDEREAALEALVWDTADPGTVIMCANLKGPPPSSWYIVLDSWQDERRGIWQKPSGSAGS